METICPFCHQKHAISEATVRKQVRCPGCHHTFTANPLTGLGTAVKTPPPTAVPRNTGGAPPLPTAFDPAVSARTAEELLAGYQGMRNRNASPLGRIVEAFKKPIRVVRLRRQVGGLQQALDTAWEKLGTLALGHRPFQPYLPRRTARAFRSSAAGQCKAEHG